VAFAATAERHHILGLGNSILAADLPIAWHRVLHARQAQRPEALKGRVADNPLHRIALITTTVAEAAATFADYARRHGWPQWVVEFTARIVALCDDAASWSLVLAAWLDDQLGPDWTREAPPWPS
jgi:hypothetical protein